MPKKIIYTVAFTTLLISSILYLNYIFIPKSDFYYRATTSIYKENDEYDVIFIGSSHIEWGIDPNYIWEKTGITSRNFAVPALDLKNSYYGLKEIIKHKKPKVIVIDVFRFYNETDAVAITNRMCNVLPFSINKIEMINSNPKLNTLGKRLDYYFPLHLYHTRKLENSDFNPQIAYIERGHYMQFGRISYNKEFTDCETKVDLTQEEKEYINRIVEIAKEENISLIFTKIPHLSAKNELKYKWNGLEAYAQANNFIYLNLNKTEYIKESGLIYTEDINDDNEESGHLNFWGARKISLLLANFIQTNYNISNKRENPTYASWNENNKDYYDLAKKLYPFLEAPKGSRLGPNDKLVLGQNLKSANNKYNLAFQNDGNLILQNDANTVLWTSNTYDKNASQFVMQNDGNLVIYDINNNAIWSSNTFDKPNSEFILQDDGNLVIYQNKTPIWSSNTNAK